MNPKDVQIIINSRDRVSCLRDLITWLRTAGYNNIFVLDNNSTYPPLLEYYEELKGQSVKVYRLGKNLLSKALWCWQAAHTVVRPPFIYTDPDVVPVSDCPHDVVEFLMRVSKHLGSPYKVGLSLKIDDIPDSYSQADKVRKWEGDHNWGPVVGTLDGVEIYSAGVDTTFALYPKFLPFEVSGVRVGHPYTARHVDWYIDSNDPTPERTYYEEHCQHGTHTWGINASYSMAVNHYCERSNAQQSA